MQEKQINLFNFMPFIVFGVLFFGVLWFYFYPQLNIAIFIFAFIFFSVNLILNILLLYNNIKLSRLNEQLKESLGENEVSAKLLVSRDRELVAANTNLISLNKELNEIGKVLIKRDLELSEANARLQELDVLKSEFVSVAAHQLRTPVTEIKWQVISLLENGSQLTPPQQQSLKNIQEITDSAVELIDDLLNIARIEEGRFGFKLVKQPIIPVVEKLLPRLKEMSRLAGVELSVQWPTPFPFLFNIDGEKITIALDNLIENAIRYTPIKGRVSVNIGKADNRLKIEIKDTGIGIPQNQLSKVFTRFFRASNALLKQPTGSGLGLYVTKNIIEHHGGAITLESEDGKGTTVAFTLPIVEELKV